MTLRVNDSECLTDFSYTLRNYRREQSGRAPRKGRKRGHGR
jgi:hypothetical protein